MRSAPWLTAAAGQGLPEPRLPPGNTKGGQALGMGVLAALFVSANPPVRLSAQVDTAQTSVTTAAAVVATPDTSRRTRPMGAFFRSLLVPGWGQAATGRHVSGAVFVAWEGVTAMMTLKARQEANYLKESGSANRGAKRQEAQDWLILWIFNHLFSGAEAFVSAHLQDFPRDLKVQAVPGGLGLSLPVPRP